MRIRSGGLGLFGMLAEEEEEEEEGVAEELDLDLAEKEEEEEEEEWRGLPVEAAACSSHVFPAVFFLFFLFVSVATLA